MSQNLALRSVRSTSPSADVRFLQELNMGLLDSGNIPDTLTKRLIATESISDADVVQLNAAAGQLQSMLSSVVSRLNMNSGMDKDGARAVFAAESAAIQGALLAKNPELATSRSFAIGIGGENVFTVNSVQVPNYLGSRSKVFATEAFDNRENRNAVLYTMAYNYCVSRQDEFGDTVWPTLTLPADQVGFGIVVNRLTVHRGVTHTVDGKVVDFGKKDLMRAEADATILQKEKTRLYPVVRSTSVNKFVDPTLVAPYAYNHEGVTITTAPYRTGVDIGIMGICQTDAQLEAGSANQTDTLDPAISLENIYIKVGDDVIKIEVYSHPTANFTYATQGIDKLRNLAFRSKSIGLGPKRKRVDGTDLVTLSPMATNDYTVVLDLGASGEANIEFAAASVTGTRCGIVKILDNTGAIVPDTNSAAQDITAAFANAAIIGYDLRTYKTNINMRERGDFIDRTNFSQLYEVPLLSPVTAQRPQNTDGQLDAGDFEALVTATRFRLKNDSVTAIFDCFRRLSDYVNGGSNGEDIPASIGAGRYHVVPTCYEPDAIDISKIVQSLNSSDLATDLASAIVNIVRDYVFRMYVNCQYQAAASALGQTSMPTVIIATDPTIRRWLMINGEIRTITDKFQVRIVDTLDTRFKGKMFITFGVFDENRNQAPNILNWGNLVYAPEVVMQASVPRGESLSRETIVQPRYLFVNHMPVATMLDLQNIPEIFAGQPYHVEVKPAP